MDDEPSILDCITSKVGLDIGIFYITFFKCIHKICTVSEVLFSHILLNMVQPMQKNPNISFHYICTT